MAGMPRPEITPETWIFWGVLVLCMVAMAVHVAGGRTGGAGKSTRPAGSTWLNPARIFGFWTTILAPAVLLLAIPLFSQLDRQVFNDLRLELTSVHVDADVLARNGVSFGGAPENEFQIEGAPGGLFELHSSGDNLQLSFPEPPLGDDAWVVEIVTPGQFGFGTSSTLHGSIPLAPGNGLCVWECTTGPASWVTLMDRAEGRYLQSPGGERGPVLIRPRVFSLSPGSLDASLSDWLGRVYSPSRRIFPLRDILPDSACPTDIGCAHLRSFLWDSDGGMQLIVLDPAVAVDRAGNVDQFGPGLPPRELEEGDELAIWRVNFAAIGFDVADRDQPASRLRGRTRFSIEPRGERDGGGATIRLPDSESMALRRRDVAREIRGSQTDRLASGGMGDPNAQISFPALGGAAAGGAQGAIYVPANLLANRSVDTVEIESRREELFQREHVLLGRPFFFQDSGVQPTFTLTQETFPGSLVFLALVGWLILVLCQYRHWQAEPLVWMLSTGVQLLLALRLVIAVEAAYMDLAVDANVRLHQATVAFLLGGGVMVLLAPAHARKSAALIAISSVIGATVLHSLSVRAFVGVPQVLIICAFVAASTAVVVRNWLAWAPQGIWKSLRDRIIDPIQKLFSSVGKYETPQGSRWLWLAALVAVVRVVLVPLGITEREIIALSAIYLPLMLWISALTLRRAMVGPPKGGDVEWFSCLCVGVAAIGMFAYAFVESPGSSPIWIGYQTAVLALAAAAFGSLVWFVVRVVKARKSGENRPVIGWWGGWGFIGVLGLLGVAVPLAVRDVGFAPLILAPLGVAGWLALSPPKKKNDDNRLRPAWAWGAPIVFCLVLLALPRMFGVATGETAQIVAAGQAESNDAALSLLERSVGLTQNPLRILLLSDPSEARQAGTSQAESLSVWSSYLESFTREPFGHGYLADVGLGPLAENHEDDNLSAVHIMSPYGRVGAVLFLGWLGILAACAAWVRGGPDVTQSHVRSTRDLLGVFFLWTPFAMGTYMILANLQMIPFTGRNVYLLAAFSGSDWLEGMALYGGALWLLARAKNTHGKKVTKGKAPQ